MPSPPIRHLQPIAGWRALSCILSPSRRNAGNRGARRKRTRGRKSVSRRGRATGPPRLWGGWRGEGDGRFGGQQQEGEGLLQIEAGGGVGVARITDREILADMQIEIAAPGA